MCRNSFGSVGVAARAEHAGDGELGLGEPLAEHRHERDRAALAQGERGRAEHRRRRLAAGCPTATARTPARSSPASACRRRSHLRAVRRVGRQHLARAPRWRSIASHVGGRRSERYSEVLGRSTLPARSHGGRPSAPVISSIGRHVWLSSCCAGSSVTGRVPARNGITSASVLRQHLRRARSSLDAPGGISTWRSASRISPVSSSSIRDRIWRAMRNVDGTTPLASPECTPSESTSTSSSPASRPRSDVVTTAGRSRRSRSRGRPPGSACRSAVGQRLDVGGQIGAAALLAGLDQHDAARVREPGPARPRSRSATRRSRSRRRRRRGRRAGRPRSPASTGRAPRASRHLGLLVEVAVEQHGVVGRAAVGGRDLHEDHRREPGDLVDLERQPGNRAGPAPVGQQIDRPLHVPELLPVRLEHRRHVRDADVVLQRRDDVPIPHLGDVVEQFLIVHGGSSRVVGGENVAARAFHWSRAPTAMTPTTMMPRRSEVHCGPCRSRTAPARRG